jgi:hypothetical protein
MRVLARVEFRTLRIKIENCKVLHARNFETDSVLA